MNTLIRFGRYELRGLIGSGGMGEVYKAFDHEQSRIVALKLLPESLASDTGFVERFKRESFAAAQLNDPHVIPIHQYGNIDGRLYIDMRLVNGLDLAQLIERDGALPPVRAVNLISQAAEALDAAHAEGLIHRDIKPSNLLVTSQDFLYLVDFGIAHVFGLSTTGRALTATGATVGTLDYMAPERFIGRRDIDSRADVYSLACVLFETLTGQRPFGVEGLPALLNAHLNTPPPSVTTARPELPPSLDGVITRGMAKDPDQRFKSAGEMAAAARAAIAGISQPTIAPHSGPALTRTDNFNAAPPTQITQPESAWAAMGTRVSHPPSDPPRRTSAKGRRMVWAAVFAVLLAGLAIAAVQLLGTGSSARDESGGTAQAASSTFAASPSTDSSPAGDSNGAQSTTSGSSTVESSPATTPSAQDPVTTVTAAPPPPQTVTLTQTTITTQVIEPPPPPAVVSDDLGLTAPVRNLGCEGSYIAIVASHITPETYARDVQNTLLKFPGASYLKTASSCTPSLTPTANGNDIYAVYFGPFANKDEACAASTNGEVRFLNGQSVAKSSLKC